MRSVIALGSILSMLAACGYDRGNGVGYPSGDAASVAVSIPSPDPLASAGETRSVTAVVKDVNQSVITAPSVSWRTSAPGVATVEGTGESATITAVDDGTAIITATSGRVEGTVTVTVRRKVMSIELSAPASALPAGTTTQLTVVGRDAREQPITGLTGATFVSSNAFNIMVSGSGLVTALFSSFTPFDAIVTATLTRDGLTLTATKHFDVTSAAPAVFDFFSHMDPVGVRPEPESSAGEGMVWFTLDGARIQYKIVWALFNTPAVSAHIHGPDDDDTVAPVLVDLPLGNQPDRSGVFSGSFSAADIRPQGGQPAISLDSLVTLMRTPGQRTPGLTYVDVRTGSSPSGEARGPVLRR